MTGVRELPAAETIRSALRSWSDPEKATMLPRFFKTGPGEYGEGDRFHGVVAPKIRKLVKRHRHAAMEEVVALLHLAYHEERMTALLILVGQYRRGDESRREAVYELYLASTPYINNWDLVDLTAGHIVGAHLHGTNTSVLTRLALSKNVWERRIAVLSDHYFIRQGESREALRIAKLLLHDSHDLIHKAVGWMLPEVGKRCSIDHECAFLDAYAAAMPRTMLRRALERFPEGLKSRCLAKGSGRGT
jgi:3-methyladenine DNA glycosylase AlkD